MIRAGVKLYGRDLASNTPGDDLGGFLRYAHGKEAKFTIESEKGKEKH